MFYESPGDTVEGSGVFLDTYGWGEPTYNISDKL